MSGDMQKLTGKVLMDEQKPQRWTPVVITPLTNGF